MLLGRVASRPLPVIGFAAALLGAALVAATVPLAAQQAPGHAEIVAPPAVVIGRIVGPDKKALEDVELVLADSLRDVTDRKGRFEFDPVPAGTHDVVVRKIGYVPIRFRLRVVAGDVWDGTITMDRTTQTLPQVVVLDSTRALRNFRPSWLDPFLERRRLGFGTFLDRVEIEQSREPRVARLIARAPGITVFEAMRYDELHVSRCGAGAGASKAILFVDGIKMEATYNGRFTVLAEYHPDQLGAVEIYRGRGAIPPQYDDPQACLIILLWTNRR